MTAGVVQAPVLGAGVVLFLAGLLLMAASSGETLNFKFQVDPERKKLALFGGLAAMILGIVVGVLSFRGDPSSDTGTNITSLTPPTTTISAPTSPAPTDQAPTPATTVSTTTEVLQVPCGGPENILCDPSFETGQGWHQNNGTSHYFDKRYDPSIAPLGVNVGIFSGENQASIIQDLARDVQAGDTYEFSLQVRADGPEPIKGQIALWIGTIGGDQEPAHNSGAPLTVFDADSTGWKRECFKITLQRSHHGTLRAEIYVLTPAHELSADNYLLFDDASVEQLLPGSPSKCPER